MQLYILTLMGRSRGGHGVWTVLDIQILVSLFQNLQGLAPPPHPQAPPLVDLCSFKQLLRCLDTQGVLATKVSKIRVISHICIQM